MSQFTAPLAVEPFVTSRGKVRWRTLRDFWWRLIDDEFSPVIYVPAGFVFDGATVPPGITAIYPRAHPLYLQAAALHDYALTHLRHELSRCQIDAIFRTAMTALGNPQWRSASMTAGVVAFGMAVERQTYYKLRPELTNQSKGHIVRPAELTAIINGDLRYA